MKQTTKEQLIQIKKAYIDEDKAPVNKMFCIFEYVEIIDNSVLFEKLLKKFAEKEIEPLADSSIGVEEIAEFDFTNCDLSLSSTSPDGKLEDNAWVFYETLKAIHGSTKAVREAYHLKLAEPIMDKFSEYNISIDQSIDDNKIEEIQSSDIIDKIFLDFHDYIISYLETMEFAHRNKNNNLFKENNINYSYDDKKNHSTFSFNDKKIIFKKNPALIMSYFHDVSLISNSYKDFEDFNIAKKMDLTSDVFRRAIDKMNARVNNWTKGALKALLVMDDDKAVSNDTNEYRWEIKA